MISPEFEIVGEEEFVAECKDWADQYKLQLKCTGGSPFGGMYTVEGSFMNIGHFLFRYHTGTDGNLDQDAWTDDMRRVG
jgi:hypothetical protein